MREQVTRTAEVLFFRYGIKSVSMDDIARELGMSKKTVYQLFDTKEALLRAIFEARQQDEIVVQKYIRENAGDAIQEILALARFVVEFLAVLPPTALFDLQKYYPVLWGELEHLHQDHVYRMLLDNLRRGMEQGVYRSEMDADIIARLHAAKVFFITDERSFPSKIYQREHVFRQFILYHLYGVVSQPGKEKLEQYLLDADNAALSATPDSTRHPEFRKNSFSGLNPDFEPIKPYTET